MNGVPIVKKSMNLEILCKITNSVAKRHDCRIKFDLAAQRARFYGEPKRRSDIIRETLSMLNWK